MYIIIDEDGVGRSSVRLSDDILKYHGFGVLTVINTFDNTTLSTNCDPDDKNSWVKLERWDNI